MIDERINNNTGIENEEQEIDLVALLFKYLFFKSSAEIFKCKAKAWISTELIQI